MIPLPSFDGLVRVCAVAFVGACGLAVGFAAGVASDAEAYAESTLRAVDTADYYARMADSAWTIVGNRQGLAADEVRECMARPVWTEGP